MAFGLKDLIWNLESFGLTDVLLPFLLIFTLVFAILQKSEILGQGKKNFNVIIALVMSLTVVIPHTSGSYQLGYDPVDIINGFLPGISLVIIGVVMLFVLLGLWGKESDWMGGSPSGMVALLAVIAVIWIFGGAANWWNGFNWFTNFFGEDTISLIIIILVFGIIIWFITKSDKETRGESAIKKMGDMFRTNSR